MGMCSYLFWCLLNRQSLHAIVIYGQCSHVGTRSLVVVELTSFLVPVYILK